MNSRESDSFENPEIQKFLKDLHLLMLKDVLVDGHKREAKVCNFKQPHEISDVIDLDLGHEPVTYDELLKLCKDVIQYSVKTGNPRFFNQLHSGVDPYGMAGSWLTDCLNTDGSKFEDAPVFVTMENYMIKKLCLLAGFDNGDGLFLPGGSYSNAMAMHLARCRYNPDIINNGMYHSQQMCVYGSQEAHYSIERGANILGIGMDNVIKVKTGEKGRMTPEELERHILETKKMKKVPLLVLTTCGTTVLGAFDDLNAIADVCHRNNVWMHVDASWGGAVLLSEKHKHLMNGVHRADSVAWNFHKWSVSPIQCAVFLIKKKGLLEKSNRLPNDYQYLVEPDIFNNNDIADKTMQCGRRVDVFKLWLMWKARGDRGMAERIDRSFENAEYLTEKLKKTEGFKLSLSEFQCTNICFWFIPKRLRGKPETEEWWKEISKIAPQIKERMLKQGTMMIGYQPLESKEFVNFFRVIVENSLCDTGDMDFIIDEIQRLGNDL